MSKGGIALFSVYISTVHERLDSELFPLTMAITKTQKLRTIRARHKNPPPPTKPHAKPGLKPKNGPCTAARFERDE